MCVVQLFIYDEWTQKKRRRRVNAQREERLRSDCNYYSVESAFDDENCICVEIERGKVGGEEKERILNSGAKYGSTFSLAFKSLAKSLCNPVFNINYAPHPMYLICKSEPV